MFKFEGENDHNILVAKYEIENEETFHMKNLYKLIHDWLLEEGFKDIFEDTENPEIFYLEKIYGTGNKEHRIWWRVIKTPFRSQYYRYYLRINFLTLNMKSIEVMHQGHKMKTDRGDCIINIEAFLQLDYNRRWRGNDPKKRPFLMRFDRLFRNRIYKAQIEAYKIDLYKTAYRLQNIIKQYLKLKTLYEMPKPFQPEKGI
ncbi:TPA: hypothetical protein HA235_03190 [Candidatus Woesearchaeota archaeon]|nr:hypothetical protein [Candidatus Woesearchaeota archaeon]HIH31688.1 hypothetical protein [Candidatus Woesearchaeota archaeon]HIH54951.1 hypothetical protein [Candidatus Woesearchaeota archaeon]HIJ02644.1 hypothetical protein [Candidatus Woesearchaeota archaeon]HIJ13618.1 hypothetical protein [Candidatus Woesearchaeota archaeon]